MGGTCEKLKKRCLCCCCCFRDSCKYEKSSTPSRVRFKRGGKSNEVEPAGDNGFQERFAIPEGTYHVKLRGEKLCSINSATFLPTGDVILADCINKNLKMFTCNFEFITLIEFPLPVQTVCASPNLPLLFCTFPDRVRQIHVDGHMLKRSGFIKTPGHCRGIAVNKFDGKAISMSMSEDEGQVNLLTPGGNLQLELTEDEEGEPLFVRPENMCVGKDLMLFVADKGNHCVLGIHRNGAIAWRYRGIRYPQSIVVDELNYIYVAGINSVHQLSEQGELVKLILSKAEIGFSPLSLSYNESKKLLLATGKGSKVRIFKLT